MLCYSTPPPYVQLRLGTSMFGSKSGSIPPAPVQPMNSSTSTFEKGYLWITCDKFFTHRFQSAWWDDSSPLISETKKSKIGKLKRHVKYQKKVSRRLEEHRPFSFSCHIISNTLHCLVKHVKVRLSFLFNVADLSSWKSWEVTKLFTTGHQNIIMSQY